MRTSKILKNILYAVGIYILMKISIVLLNASLGSFISSLKDSEYIAYISQYHTIIKRMMFFMAFLPVLQTFRLVKTKRARDVSWSYQLLTILSIAALSTDIFRTQYGFSTINYFNIVCGFIKIVLYDLNLMLIFFYRKNFRSQIFKIFLLILIEMGIVLGIFVFQESFYRFINIDIIEAALMFVLMIGMIKPALQLRVTLVKKTAQDVSLLYYIVFVVYLTCSIHDNIIVSHINSVDLPVRNVTINMIKWIFYVITLGVIIKYRIRDMRERKNS